MRADFQPPAAPISWVEVPARLSPATRATRPECSEKPSPGPALRGRIRRRSAARRAVHRQQSAAEGGPP